MEKFTSPLEAQIIEYSMSLGFDDLSQKAIKQAKRRITDTIGGALGASVLFFIISNFAVWLSDPDYPLTWGGLLLCYEMAIPFFRGTLASDLLYSAAFFGIMEWVRHSSSTLSWDEKLVE